MDDGATKLIKDLFVAVEEKNGGKLSSDQLSRISLKLGQMLGNPGSHVVAQNEKGQILNEEGLPVIEISEQVGPEQASASTSIAPPSSIDLPTWTLSEGEKVRRRVERERILDTLEEEERLEEERKAAEEEESRAARKERLQATRELHKAMGRALVKNVKDSKMKEEQARIALLEVDTTVGADKSKRLKPKKSVSFDLPPEESPVSPGPQQDWGDVTPARLQPKRSLTPDPHGPMKFQVVERFPQKLRLGSSPKDSDDESEPEPVPDSEEDSSPEKDVEFDSDETTEDGGDLEFQEGETDLDAAQHQREIALTYYEKKGKFAAQAAAVFSSHSHVKEDPWDLPEVPLEANLTGDRPKPAISKFKADRIVSSSTSLDGLVVPASQSVLVRDAVKLGKIEGDQLVGGSEDSDDDLREIMGLIGQGEVENIGHSLQNGSSPLAADQDSSSPPPPKTGNQTSRFKINRGGTPRPGGYTTESIPLLNVEPSIPVVTDVTERQGILRLEPNHSIRSSSRSPSVPDTPLTAIGRSSPKLPSGDIPVVTDDLLSSPISSKPVESRQTSQSTASTVHEPAPVSGIIRERTPRTSKKQPPVVVESPSFKSSLSTIIDSPSFVLPKGPSSAFPSMIVDSSDFPPPPGVATTPLMTIDSPEFTPQGVSPTSTTTSLNTPAPLVIDSPSFPVRQKYPGPPRVMSSQVVERSPVCVNKPRQDVPSKKVSRFASERR